MSISRRSLAVAQTYSRLRLAGPEQAEFMSVHRYCLSSSLTLPGSLALAYPSQTIDEPQEGLRDGLYAFAFC